MLSFVYVGIYWNNHHHMLHTCTRVNGAILWANLHLLFWLSLLPFATGWMGENHFAPLPSALYGAVLLAAAIAYYVLQQAIIAAQGEQSVLKRAVGGDWKGKVSPLFYLLGIGLTFVSVWLAQALYVLVAVIIVLPPLQGTCNASVPACRDGKAAVRSGWSSGADSRAESRRRDQAGRALHATRAQDAPLRPSTTQSDRA